MMVYGLKMGMAAGVPPTVAGRPVPLCRVRRKVTFSAGATPVLCTVLPECFSYSVVYRGAIMIANQTTASPVDLDSATYTQRAGSSRDY